VMSGAHAVCAPAERFDEANRYSEQQKFPEAKRIYEELVGEGRWSANLFYNLAGAEYRLGSPGRAMLNYERAVALEPSNVDALRNLRFLRDQTGARLGEPPFVERVLMKIPERAWTILGAAAAWVTVFSLGGIAISRRREKAGLWWAAAFGLIGTVLAGTGVFFHAQDAHLGIVTAKEADARLAPAETAGLAESLPAGSRVRILSERGEWVYCLLPGERRGWIGSGNVERVRLGKS
jgi:tetratricopeptide (TPR) repeat protein